MHGGVYASFFNEFVVGALLDYAVLGEDDDAVGISDRREPVGDCERGAAFGELGEGLLYVVLALVVEG